MNLDLWVSIVLPILISVVVPLLLGRAQAKSLKVDIEAKYKKMLDETISELDKLRDDYFALKKAFTRAIAFIRVIHNGEIPDFFEDTGDLKKK